MLLLIFVFSHKKITNFYYLEPLYKGPKNVFFRLNQQFLGNVNSKLE